ncbi:SDR family NAD(P)-dependent oxidoreductase [Chitinibacter tainanensis]|uniref:SDR family NAD(P)-dependent oxidoreductase n=1 Tax=Chitinibacter tainanensis TaxID=230667 RepID=UPI0023562D66|nr:SDR family NAD(P)-dependent oxidoreductase [Chitinibacter tainanensis]
MWRPLNRPLPSLAGQVIWLIGASSGIGAALAEQALAAGARVALSARRESALQQVAAQHPAALVLPLDVTDAAAWAPAYAQLLAQFGSPDLVLFCAADYRPERVWEVDAARAEATLQLNLASVYHALQTVLPDMLARRQGGIGLIASVAGLIGLPNASVYGPSKAALINLAEILYCDLAPHGLNVYLINPGFVQTGLTAKNQFVMPALQTPAQAASAIWRGVARGAFEIHFPQRFTWWLKLARILPYRLRFYILQRFVGNTLPGMPYQPPRKAPSQSVLRHDEGAR